MPQMARIRQLSLMLEPSRRGLRALAAAEGLSSVRVMSVSSSNAGPTFAALARCPSLRGLADLFLKAGLPNLTPEGLAVILDSDNVANLVALRLDMIYLKEQSALVVSRSPRLAGLKILRIVGRIGDGGARALSECPHLSDLDTLELHCFDSLSAAVRGALRERFGAALHFRR
jgi:hypothetical protein